jgi:DNA-binding MarR family transcriptional regulator
MSRFEGPGESPGFLLWHATTRWQRLMTSTLAPLGLTHVQFVLLASAWWMQTHDESPTQVRLAAQAGTDVTMTSDVLRRLEGKGLVRRDTHASDARAKVVVVTDEGADVAARAIEAVEAADAAFFGDIDAKALVPTLVTLSGLTD